jgi:predicted RNase H-like nuclease
VEPCRRGWLVVSAKLQGVSMLPQPPEVHGAFAEVLDARPGFSVLAVHLPIGLADLSSPGGRSCDRLARKLLGPHRGASVISPPARSTVQDPEGKGLSAVARALLPRIAELNRDVASYHQRSVHEFHPELSFYQLNDDRPLRFRKRTADGVEERMALLGERVKGMDRILEHRPPGVDLARLLDACAGLWTARRIAARSVSRLPESPEWDEQGVRMELVR